ncbi:MAG: DUF3619 family protein [Burkholderiaceae bacterium]
MNKQHHSSHFALELDARVSRFGKRVASSLTERGDALPHDVTERLRFAREQALLKARSVRAPQLATQTGAGVVRAGAALALGGAGGAGGSSPWFKLATLMPLLLLVAGLLLIQHGQWYEQVMASAEIDTALLSDKLPPAAYGDPGFTEYLSEQE